MSYTDNEPLFPTTPISPRRRNMFITTHGSAPENSFNIPVLNVETRRQTAFRRKMKWRMRKLLKKKHFEKKKRPNPKNEKNRKFLKLLKEEKQKKLLKKRLRKRWGLKLNNYVDGGPEFGNNENLEKWQREKFNDKVKEIERTFSKPEERDIAVLDKLRLRSSSIMGKKHKISIKVNRAGSRSPFDHKTSLVISKLSKSRKCLASTKKETAFNLLRNSKSDSDLKFSDFDYDLDCILQTYKAPGTKKMAYSIKNKRRSTKESKKSVVEIASKYGSLRPSLNESEFSIKKRQKVIFVPKGFMFKKHGSESKISTGWGSYAKKRSKTIKDSNSKQFDWRSFDIE